MQNETNSVNISSLLFSNRYFEKAEDKKTKEQYYLIRNVMSIHFDKGSSQYRSMVEWNNGSKSFSVDDLTDDNCIVLSDLENSKLPDLISARINDILWTIFSGFENIIFIMH